MRCSLIRSSVLATTGSLEIRWRLVSCHSGSRHLSMLRDLGRFERTLRESRDTRENLVSRLRPHKRLGIDLMGLDEFLNGRFQLRHASVGATPQLLVVSCLS